ncbi:MAG: glycosyltransferase family 87 protein [Pseudomonadota bacterium]
MINALVNASWVDAERVKWYPVILTTMLAATTVFVLFVNDGLLPNGAPFGSDFVSFWIAAREGLFGDPVLVYNRETFDPLQKEVFPDAGFFAFFYPPHYQMLLLPLGSLPYYAALIVWQLITFAFVAWVMTRITGEVRLTLILAVAFPAAFLTLAHGQNAFLSAALFAAGLFYLPKRPVLAGVMFGILTFKPQLGLLIPVALIAAWQWKAIFSAAVTAISLAALSVAVLGIDVWAAFMAQATAATNALEVGAVGWSKMISLYSALRGFGIPYALAMSLHALVALTVAVAILAVWRRGSRVDHALKCAMLMVGALIVTPFGLNYDLYLLAPAAAFLLASVPWSALTGAERNALVALFVLPITILMTMNIGFSLAPWLVFAAFVVIAMRAFGISTVQATETAVAQA